MKIDPELCIACEACLEYCTMGIISMSDDVAAVDQDECVECGICLRSGVCPVDAFIDEKLAWPRQLRAEFSNPLVKHHSTGGAGRGTEEVKTNEVTGRPSVGTRFHNVDLVAQVLAKEGVTFEPENPVTALMEDPKTGKMRKDVLNEKVISAIIECVFPREKGPSVIKALQEATKKIDTVCSVVMADLVEPDESVPLEKTLNEMGIFHRINGKTNVGLGRPKYKGGS